MCFYDKKLLPDAFSASSLRIDKKAMCIMISIKIMKIIIIGLLYTGMKAALELRTARA